MNRGKRFLTGWVTVAAAFWGFSGRAAAEFFVELHAVAGSTEQSDKDSESFSGGLVGASASASYGFEDAAELGFAGSASASAVMTVGLLDLSLGLNARARMDTGSDVIGATASAFGTFGDTIPLDEAEDVGLEAGDIITMYFRVSGSVLNNASVLYGIDGGDGRRGFDLTQGTHFFVHKIPMVVHEGGIEDSPFVEYVIDATVSAGSTDSGTQSQANFSQSFTVLGFKVTDDNGNPIDIPLIGVSGVTYAVNPTVVPEPSGVLLLASGLGSIACCLGLRRFGRRVLMRS